MSRRAAEWFIIGIIAVAMAVSTYAAMTALNTAHRNTEVAHRLARQQRTIDASVKAKARDDKVAAYATCLRGNIVRSHIRSALDDELQVIFKGLPGQRQRSAAQQKVINDLLVRLHVLFVKILPGADCAKIGPSHLSPAERATLPKPEPVPPLILR